MTFEMDEYCKEYNQRLSDTLIKYRESGYIPICELARLLKKSESSVRTAITHGTGRFGFAYRSSDTKNYTSCYPIALVWREFRA